MEQRNKQPRHLVIGIDPGFRGAVAITDGKTIHDILDMPLNAPRVLAPEARQTIDAEALARYLSIWAPKCTLAVIEGVHAMPGQGESSTFRFGEGYGMLQGIMATHVAASNIRVILPRPSVWKMQMGVTADKGSSLRLARKLFPEFETKYFSRIKDDGRAEALLLALFGRRSLSIPSTGGDRLNDIL